MTKATYRRDLLFEFRILEGEAVMSEVEMHGPGGQSRKLGGDFSIANVKQTAT